MISIIIPTYNTEAHLSHLFSCLQAQSFRDFEVLLINDGSTDQSGKFCEEIVCADARFRYLPQENSGVSAARNRGIQASRGEYITFLDADDEIPADYLKVLLTALENSHAQMSVCDVTVIENGKEVNRFSCSQQLSQKEALEHILSRRYINSGPYAKLFRRDLLQQVSFPPLKAYEDILFVVDAVCRCSDIAATSDTEYRYVQNQSGAMSSFLKLPSTDIIAATDQLLVFLKGRPELDPYCTYITASHLMQYVQALLPMHNPQANTFLRSAQNLFRKHLLSIVTCHAFPRKEKALFALFGFGWVYHEKKLSKLR